ncbi:MAG TPA: ATP-binding protein [Clostridia bacterium]|nr:ATP-binding protein [Clostridia bacterium]
MMQEISLNILDIAQNSVSAGASLIEITVDEQPGPDSLIVTIRDNGKGMTPEQVEAVTDPFYTTRTTRKVGLGVPFFKMAAEMSGGSFSIRSKVGEGTVVCGKFGLSNIDRMPIGDVNATILTLITCNPGLDFVYTRRKGGGEFILDTREVRNVLGEVPLNNGEVTLWIRDFLREGEAEVAPDNPQ